MAIGDNLKLLREMKDLSRKQMAGILNVSDENYRRWETNKRPVPANRKVELANFFNITVEELESGSFMNNGQPVFCQADKEMLEKLYAHKNKALGDFELFLALVKIVWDWLGKGK